MTGQGVWPHLAGSARLFRARPLVLGGLGGAVVLSLITVCCGVGALSSPFFMCELFAVQLGIGREQPIARTRAFVGAALILFGAVLLLGSVAWLTLLGLGPDMATGEASQPGQAGAQGPLGVGSLLAAGCTAMALVFVLPYLYAPLILIERGGSFGAAVLESARLVHLGGLFAQLRLSLSAHLLIAAPLLLPALVALVAFDVEAVPFGMLLGVPLTCASVPLGQGMFVHSYVGLRDRLDDARHVVAPGRPPPRLVAALALTALSPALALGMLGASLVRPASIGQGALPADAELLFDGAIRAGERVRYEPPQTALRIEATPHGVRVAASDGGGAGRLPLPGRPTFERLRVGRSRDVYGIEVRGGAGSYVTWIDRAGVRRDDGLRARFVDRLPGWGLLFILVSLLLTSLLQLPVLSRLADLRREHVLLGESRSGSAALEQQRARALGFAGRALALAILPALGSLYLGLRSLFGPGVLP